MLLFDLGPLAWGKVLFVAFIIHLANTLYLGEVLGRAFDPYWRPRLYHAGYGWRAQYLATLAYVGAILFDGVRRSVFGDNGFDFRSRVSGLTAFLCLAQCLLLLVVLGTAGVIAWLVARDAWAAWQSLPRPAPPPPVPEPPPL